MTIRSVPLPILLHPIRAFRSHRYASSPVTAALTLASLHHVHAYHVPTLHRVIRLPDTLIPVSPPTLTPSPRHT